MQSNILEDCFETDFNHTRIMRMCKNTGELEKIKLLLWEYYE